MKARLQSTVERSIYTIRGQRVMLDADLAVLYGVTTGNLNKAAARNRSRFPRDFMFRLTRKEAANLIFQIGISSSSHGGRRQLPFVFTEQGVAMLSSVLHSERAVEVNIEIMRAFVRLRQLLATHVDLARKLERLERKYDGRFRIVFTAIRQLMAEPPEPPRRRIGFHARMRMIGPAAGTPPTVKA